MAHLRFLSDKLKIPEPFQTKRSQSCPDRFVSKEALCAQKQGHAKKSTSRPTWAAISRQCFTNCARHEKFCLQPPSLGLRVAGPGRAWSGPDFFLTPPPVVGRYDAVLELKLGSTLEALHVAAESKASTMSQQGGCYQVGPAVPLPRVFARLLPSGLAQSFVGSGA